MTLLMFANHPQRPPQTPRPLEVELIAAGAACVLLRHDLPDGTGHFDWLLEGGSSQVSRPEAHDLIAFRLASRVDELTAGQFLTAERSTDHRRIYLDFEGEIAGGRGRVAQLARGRVLNVRTAPNAVELEIRWHFPAQPPLILQRLRIERDADHRWTVRCVSREISAQ